MDNMMIEALVQMVRNGKITLEQIKEKNPLTYEEVKKRLAEN